MQLDFIVLVIFAFMIFLIGAAFTRMGSKNGQAFFEAGGATPWWINGLSLFISYFSAGTFVVWGSIAYRHGLVANTIQLTMSISGLIVALFIARRWKRTGVRTASEYIGKRFGTATQQFYTYLVLLLSLFSTASVLYPVGRMVHVATPFSLETCIIIIGLIIVLYTAAGGLWAVLVTDVVQFVILTASVIIVIPIAFSAIGGPERLVSDTPVGFFDLFNEEYTLPFMLAFILYQTVYIGGNWSYVQRYTSVRDENRSARVAWLFTLLYLVSPFIWMIPPMIYRVLNPDLNGLGVEGAYMMLCKQVLPPGLIGLVLAGMISATSSKANTTINLAATVFATDLYRSALRRKAGDRELILMARLFTLLFGAATVGLALWIPRLGGIVDFVLSVASIAGGALFAPIIWSLFSARQTARSVVTVTVTTLLLNLGLKFLLPVVYSISLSRTLETVIGQCTPLLMLAGFEWYYRKRKVEININSGYASPLVSEEGSDQEDAEVQNRFGIRVIALSMALTGAGIVVLGILADHSTAVTAFTGLAIVLISIWIWRKTLPMKVTLIGLIFISMAAQAQRPAVALKRVLVNQAGYNLSESKRCVAWGAADGQAFNIRNTKDGKIVYTGRITSSAGDFSDFDPGVSGPYVIETPGHQPSVPFEIRPFHLETISSKLAYDFFMDVRGSTDPVHSNESKVYGGGPSRDCGSYTLETVFETMFYASNPALFDRWKVEMGGGKMPDLIALILWHAEFAYHHHAYNGPVGNRHGWLGYEGTSKMNYDYWNTLDQLAAVCAAYEPFLKPWLPEERYRAYRKLCLEKWEAYERHKVLRYWTYSNKWVDVGYQEFNEMGHAFGQSVFSNLFMYMTELNEPDGKPEKFLRYAQESAADIIKNWDFTNIPHMWWIRNAAHITPQALAFFLMQYPDKAPAGTREKLNGWMDHILSRSRNPWQYRTHSDVEWAHPKTKELGGPPALGGSLFAAGHVLGRQDGRSVAWSQIDFTFGLNPVGAHFSNKSQERLDINGYWPGIEVGWPKAHPNGYGMLGRVRGTLDGTPMDADFPRINAQRSDTSGTFVTDKIGLDAYATEGWAVSNRGWMATVTFSSLHATDIRFLDRRGNKTEQARAGQPVRILLRAPLNIETGKPDSGWVELKSPDGQVEKITVIETGADTGIFEASVPVRKAGLWTASYGYWGFRKQALLTIK